MNFVHETLAQRIRFAPGAARAALADEAASADRVMVIASAREMPRARDITTGLPVALCYDDVVEHVPLPVAERASEAARLHDVDLLVCVGGGSATGLAKAIALVSGVPIVAVPTTYAGSEATNVWGLTEGTTKTTGIDARLLPRAIVYDAELTLTLPVDLSVASGLNALAHCVDSMWAPRTDPIDAALAAEGIRALADGLPRIVTDPADLDGRSETLYGAYLAAVAFASAGSGLHHKICHVLGGRYGLPHAPTHAVALPYVLALNAPGAPDAEKRLSRAFGTATGLDGLQALRARLDAPHALRDYGFREEQIDDAVSAILPAVPSSNPVPVTPDNLARLLRGAWEGTDPQ